MTIQVDPKLCKGCGTCLESCPAGAIQLVAGYAVIDGDLCTQCNACVDACPNGALVMLSVPTLSAQRLALPGVGSRISPAAVQVEVPAKVPAVGGLGQVAGSILIILGHELGPRLADVLAGALERRLAPPPSPKTTALPGTSGRSTLQARGKQRRVRYRRGRANWKNLEERR